MSETPVEQSRVTRQTPRNWHSGQALSRFAARRPAQLTALVGFVVVAGAIAITLASGQETHNIPVCNQATQVNTVCNSQNALTLTQQGQGWWHTDGVQIFDSSNSPVHLRGVDDGRMVQTTPGTLAASEFSNLSGWGFNFIRLGVSWANLEPSAPTGSGTLTHAWDPTYLASIDSVVKQAAANHIRVVLDFHQVNWSPKFSGTGMPPWLFPANPTEGVAKCEFMTNTIESGSPESQQAGLTAAEQMIAQRYLSDPTVVGIDMFNEPQSCNYNGTQTYFVPTGGTPYDDFYHNVGTALHSINSNLLLIYEDDAYQSYLKQGFALNRALDVPNAVYSMHMYPDSWAAGNDGTSCQVVTTKTGQQMYSEHIGRANGWNQPMYIGEFDGFHLAANTCTPLSTASSDLLTLMSSAKNDNVNWSLWEYDRTGQSLIDSSGNPKQPLLSDLQTGLDSPAGTTQSGAESGSVTLCSVGSGAYNSWNTLAANAAVPQGTAVSVKLATASGDCSTPTNQSAFSTPITISDSATAGATNPNQLTGLNLADSKVLIIEVDLSSNDSTITPALNSLSLVDTPVNQPPSVPTGLRGTPSMNSVALSWTASTDDNDAQSALTYKLFRGGVFLWQTTAGTTTYTNSGLSPGTTYAYTVSACDSQGSCSNPSAPLSVTTTQDTAPPSVPTGLSTSSTKTATTLKWTASTDNVTPQAQLTYRVYRNTALLATTSPGVVTYVDSNLKPGTRNSYAVSACDLAGNCSAQTAPKTTQTAKH